MSVELKGEKSERGASSSPFGCELLVSGCERGKGFALAEQSLRGVVGPAVEKKES